MSKQLRQTLIDLKYQRKIEAAKNAWGKYRNGFLLTDRTIHCIETIGADLFLTRRLRRPNCEKFEIKREVE